MAENAGEISKETRIGIITYTDAEYNYVWSSHLGTLELRYPLNPQMPFTVNFNFENDMIAIRIGRLAFSQRKK